jgi:hypothetical protein
LRQLGAHADGAGERADKQLARAGRREFFCHPAEPARRMEEQ